MCCFDKFHRIDTIVPDRESVRLFRIGPDALQGRFHVEPFAPLTADRYGRAGAGTGICIAIRIRRISLVWGEVYTDCTRHGRVRDVRVHTPCRASYYDRRPRAHESVKVSTCAPPAAASKRIPAPVAALT